MGVPGLACFEEGIDDDQELSHAGGEDDFEGFAMLSQSICEGLDDRVAASGCQSGHVEDGADGFAAAADGAFASVLAAVAIEGRQAHEGGDLLAVELAQLGNVGDEGGGRDSAQSWNGLDELRFFPPVLVGLDELLDRGFDAFDLPLEELEDGLDALPGSLGGGDFEAIGLHGSQVDELSSAGDELLDFGLFFRSFLGGWGLDLLGIEGQDAGIEAVGFGDQAQRPGEITDPFGVDDGHPVAGIEQVRDDLALVATGGFQDDETAGGIGQQLAELLMTGAVVGQGVSLTGGEEVEVERSLGHVDPDPSAIRAIHGDVPFLPMRARGRLVGLAAPATVRAEFQRPATILLCDGVLSAEARTICRRFFRGWLRSQPRNR